MNFQSTVKILIPIIMVTSVGSVAVAISWLWGIYPLFRGEVSAELEDRSHVPHLISFMCVSILCGLRSFGFCCAYDIGAMEAMIPPIIELNEMSLQEQKSKIACGWMKNVTGRKIISTNNPKGESL